MTTATFTVCFRRCADIWSPAEPRRLTLRQAHTACADLGGFAAASLPFLFVNVPDVPFFSTAPNGASYTSPGQRPGCWITNEDQALKGRNHRRRRHVVRPFRATHSNIASFPKRCPGLSDFAPLGLKDNALMHPRVNVPVSLNEKREPAFGKPVPNGASIVSPASRQVR
jgi:hypothetical protein